MACDPALSGFALPALPTAFEARDVAARVRFSAANIALTSADEVIGPRRVALAVAAIPPGRWHTFEHIILHGAAAAWCV